jgi:hypothetical protein
VVEPDDLAPVLLERGARTSLPELLALTQKPSEEFLEGFYRERVPARGGCGRRG